jgi:4-amino-4-deoxy-L-arabinose transferase-like glycosyltransferase
MKFLTNWKILLCAIILLAGILRFVKLDSVPASLYWDEVSQGYNSYSILQTGRDEHQEFLPIARFQAFGDYKAPVYIYLDVPFIFIFGKTSLAVRFPSALFGTLTVLVTFFLVRELFGRRKLDKEVRNEKNHLGSFSLSQTHIALLSAFFLAISPWHIQLSRVAYEGNVATFFTVCGAWLFFVSIRRNMWFFILSVISFVLAFYAFNAHRVFVPLLVIFFVAVYLREFWHHKKQTIIAGCIGIMMLLPYISFFKSPESKLRFNEVNIFTDLDVVKKSNEWTQYNASNPLAPLIHNRRVLYGFSYIQHYLDFFNPTYLFISGDVNPRFSSQDVGELFLWELPLLLVGIYTVANGNKKTAIILFGWFLLAPVAAATARETPHALRSATFIPTYEIFIAIGFLFLVNLVKRFRFGLLLFLTVWSGVFVISCFIFIFSTFRFPFFN